MNIFTDIVLELIGSAPESSSERGLVGTLTTASVLSAAFALWRLLTGPNPFADLWSLGAVLAALAIGGAALLTSVLHLSRNASDRVFAVVCLVVNGAAVAAVGFSVGVR